MVANGGKGFTRQTTAKIGVALFENDPTFGETDSGRCRTDGTVDDYD